MLAPPTAIHTYAPALNHLAFQSFDSNRIRLRLFQERVVHTKLYIYVYIYYEIT